jgi:hypothetical protein
MSHDSSVLPISAESAKKTAVREFGNVPVKATSQFDNDRKTGDNAQEPLKCAMSGHGFAWDFLTWVAGIAAWNRRFQLSRPSDMR